MSKFIVSKSLGLCGKVEISGAKNAVLPILCACILTEKECVLSSVPPLMDVYAMMDILKALGVKVQYDSVNQIAKIKAERVTKTKEEYEMAGKLRASFLVMGPLLARRQKAKIPLPGGCQIGTRPVDLHLKGFIKLGAKIKQEHGFVMGRCRRLVGSHIYLDFPSVGATENIMMAAVLADGVTVIENAAVEPEIVDLAEFLNKMGAKITDYGTGAITINGVKTLEGANHNVIPDRIEAGTFMVAAAITGGDIFLTNAVPDHLGAITSKLKEANVDIEELAHGIRVCTKGEITAFNLKTMPFPGFPTDLQAVFMSLSTVAKGTSVITETVFENRFLHAGELTRMGADIKIDGRIAVVDGVRKLTATQVKATDLRAGAALVLAAMTAEGETEISDIFHIDRGYCLFEEKLIKLGAKIRRED
ncbi:MAG TPA: UDP-N-acetylglucosamine 1-carboxyvinyltransferase [Lachnospiraceae bacterium]|nr:UDP-N-acetylglucosamine 1-carboxyvinyltransferase [Lachnospiraceae bacterium]